MIKKLLFWTALFLAFKIIVVFLIGHFETDPRRNIAARVQLSEAFHPNTVFIGTSRTLYGINPAVFDSLNHNQTRSYNMGLFSLSFGNALQIARKSLDSRKVKTVFIELSALDYSTILLSPDHIFHDAAFRTQAALASGNAGEHTQVDGFLTGLNSTIFQTFSIAPQIATMKKHFNPVDHPVEGQPKLLPNGFQSVKQAFAGQNTVVINNRFFSEKINASSNAVKPNAYILSRINALISWAESRNKKVLFYIPNNITESEFEALSQVVHYIPDANLIALPKDSRLDAIFKPENLFDSHHLNVKGSVIFTTYLQEQFIKKHI